MSIINIFPKVLWEHQCVSIFWWDLYSESLLEPINTSYTVLCTRFISHSAHKQLHHITLSNSEWCTFEYIWPTSSTLNAEITPDSILCTCKALYDYCKVYAHFSTVFSVCFFIYCNINNKFLKIPISNRKPKQANYPY